jgi:FlaA1/EpsC-like NDP-sugar epimerase
MIIFIFSKIIIMDISRNYHLEDKVEYIIALVNEERMIRLSGVKGIEIRFTGLRDGEKLNEDETSKPTFHPKIKIAQVRAYDYADANLRIDALVRACAVEGDMQIVKRMKEIVPEFKSQHSKYEVLDE